MKYLKVIWNWIKSLFIGAVLEELDKLKIQLEAYKNTESDLLQQIERLDMINNSLQGNIVKAANKYATDTNALKAKGRYKDIQIGLLKGEIDLKKRSTPNE